MDYCKGSYLVTKGHLVTKRSRRLMIGTELKLVTGKSFCVWFGYVHGSVGAVVFYKGWSDVEGFIWLLLVSFCVFLKISGCGYKGIVWELR